MLHKLIALFLHRMHFRIAEKMDKHLQAATKAANDAAALAVNHEQATQANVAALSTAIQQAQSKNDQVQETAKSMAEKAEAFKHLL